MSDITVKFGAQDENLSETLTRIQRQLGNLEDKAEDTSTKFDGGFGKIAGAAAIAGGAVAVAMKAISVATDAAAAVMRGFGDAIELGGRLADLSKRTGETAGNLVVLERAFANTGVGADKAGSTINRLQKFIESANNSSSKQAATLSSLGLSMSDLAGKTPVEQMEVFAHRISQISDPTQKASAAMAIFGKSGGELLPIFADFSGEIQGARDQLGSLPDIMDRSSATFDSIGDSMDAAKTKSMEFAAGILDKLSPAFTGFMNEVAGFDAAGWGQKLGDAIMKVTKMLIGAFKSPMTAVDALGNALSAHMRNVGNLYLNAFITGGDFIKRFWTSDVPPLLLSVFGNGLITAYATSGKFLLDTFNKAIEGFYNNFGNVISAIGQFYSGVFSKVFSAAGLDFYNAITNPIQFVSGKLASALTQASNDGSLAFKEGYEKASGNVLVKLSGGLGEVADVFGAKTSESAQEIKNKFGQLVAETEPSAKDFFGAEGATERLMGNLSKLETLGKEFTDQFEESKNDSVILANNGMRLANDLSRAGEKLKKHTKEASDDMEKIRTLGDLIAAQNAAAPMKSFSEQVKQAKKDLEGLKDFIGGDFSRMSIPDLAKKLGIETANKDQKELFADIQKRINKYKDQEINILIKKDATKESIEETLKEIKNRFEIFGDYSPLELNMTAEKSIAKIKDSLKQEVDVALSSSQGTKILEAIKTAVDVIKTTVQAIEPKLPQTALGV